MDPEEKKTDKLDESEMIKGEESFVKNEAEPMTASGQPVLEQTDKGFDIKAEKEEDPAADPPPNDGPEEKESDGDGDDKPKEGKKPPFGKKPDDEDKPDPKKAVMTYGGALKSLGGGRVGGYLVSFGGPQDTDLSGEWFDEATNFHFDDGYPVKGEPVLYHHGLDKTLGVKRIGQIDTMRLDKVGIWAEAQLDLNNEYCRAIEKLAEKGKLSYSSGALPQGVQIAKSGHITDWPIIEGSLTPMPMQPFKTTIIPVKSLPEAGDLLAAVEETVSETPDSRKAIPSEGAVTMTLMQERMVDSVLSAFTSAANINLTPEEAATARKAAVEKLAEMGGEDDSKVRDYAKSAEFIDLVEGTIRRLQASDDVEAAVKARLAAKSQPAPQASGFRTDSPISVRSKYADLSAQDMAFLALTRKGVAARNGDVWQEDNFVPEMIDKAQKALNEGKIKVEPNAMKGIMAVKANELHHTTNTGYGAEWVADLWSSDLWSKERFAQSVVASRIRTIDLPSDPYTPPLEASDPTIYHVPETTNEDQLALDNSNTPIPDSKMGTGNLTITTEKIGGRVMFSTEITEDSIIPFVPQLRGQLMRSIADAIDYTIINGDTHIGTASVSYKGGTTTSTMVFTTLNGIRKHALGRTADGTVNMNGTVTLTALRQARFKLSPPLAVNLANLVMFVDVQTYGAMLNLDQLNMWWQNGRDATINTGQLPMIDGIPVVPSDQMTMADATGYVTSNTALNVKGQLLLVPLNQWVMGYRRRVNATVEFLSYYDSYQLTATARVGMINRDSLNAVNAVLMYNITTL